MKMHINNYSSVAFNGLNINKTKKNDNSTRTATLDTNDSVNLSSHKKTDFVSKVSVLLKGIISFIKSLINMLFKDKKVKNDITPDSTSKSDGKTSKPDNKPGQAIIVTAQGEEAENDEKIVSSDDSEQTDATEDPTDAENDEKDYSDEYTYLDDVFYLKANEGGILQAIKDYIANSTLEFVETGNKTGIIYRSNEVLLYSGQYYFEEITDKGEIIPHYMDPAQLQDYKAQLMMNVLAEEIDKNRTNRFESYESQLRSILDKVKEQNEVSDDEYMQANKLYMDAKSFMLKIDSDENTSESDKSKYLKMLDSISDIMQSITNIRENRCSSEENTTDNETTNKKYKYAFEEDEEEYDDLGYPNNDSNWQNNQDYDWA